MSDIVYIVGLLISGFVSVSIILDFMDKVFERVYKEKWKYYIAKASYVILLAGVNSLNNGWLNIITTVGLAAFVGFMLYSGNRKKIFFYNLCLIICMGACELVGIAILHYIYQLFQVHVISEKMKEFLDQTINQVFVIFIYDIFLLQILRKKDIRDLTYKQYFLSYLYAVFSMVNIYTLHIILGKTSSKAEILLVVFTTVGIVIINACFLNILEFISEINQLQYQNHLFVQQSRMQYKYYDKLELQYRDSLRILHDVKRHMWAIEELYRNKEEETAAEYTKNVNEIIGSFKMNEFTDNRMLNIILNDKKRIAEQHQITFTCKIEQTDLNFIEYIDLTTIFANLLDNAIEACLEVTGERVILVQVGTFNNLVMINIKNTMKDMPLGIGDDIKSSKSGHEGLGLGNVRKVVNKYYGDFNIQKEGNLCSCNIVLSKQGKTVENPLTGLHNIF
jgi:Histidine kinase-, DNA gyrase B-, and HSP90-like ATPase.